MEKITQALGALVLLIVAATAAGTVLYLVWPVGVQAFHGLVKNGILNPSLTWWQSVCLTYVFTTLFRKSK